jgi:hypothetical protein
LRRHFSEINHHDTPLTSIKGGSAYGGEPHAKEYYNSFILPALLLLRLWPAPSIHPAPETTSWSASCRTSHKKAHPNHGKLNSYNILQISLN